MLWMIIIVLALLIPISAIFLDSELGRALASRVDGRTTGLDEGVGARLSALEAEIERLSEDVKQLEEQGEFLQRLLEGRAEEDAGALPPPGDQKS
jgi:hypothetical protein